jgi:hypothetical protein
MKTTPFPHGVLALTIALCTVLTLTALTLTACDNDDDKDKYTPLYPYPSATITEGTPNGLAFEGAVTIKTGDTYTREAWDAVVANVITAFNAAYEATTTYTALYDFVFGGDGVQIILVNNLATDWEVKQTLPTGENVNGKLYIKTGSINTMTASNYDLAIIAVRVNNPATSQD